MRRLNQYDRREAKMVVTVGFRTHLVVCSAEIRWYSWKEVPILSVAEQDANDEIAISDRFASLHPSKSQLNVIRIHIVGVRS